ncbi:hypothetical protein ONZ45_g16399 [Pleurotus djamor]|nr:hypothetical protein ONZ45_g16399 [Pleurotus djamor]
METSHSYLSFIGIVDFAPEANWVFMTDSVTDLLGYEPSDLIGTPSLQLVHPDEFPRVQKMHYNTIQEDKAAVIAYLRLRHKDPYKGTRTPEPQAENADLDFDLLPLQSFRTALILDRFSVNCPIVYCSNDLLLSTTTAMGRSFFDFVAKKDEDIVRSWMDVVKGWGKVETRVPGYLNHLHQETAKVLHLDPEHQVFDPEAILSFDRVFMLFCPPIPHAKFQWMPYFQRIRME